MTEPSRDLARAARRFADSNSGRIQSAASSTGQFVLTVMSVRAGAARDGNAVVTVLWRGAETTCAGYAAQYTPVVGDRVVCDYIDNQLFAAYRIVGTP